MAWGFDSGAAEHFSDGEEEDPEIEAEAGVTGVPDIHGEAFGPIDGVASIHLGPTGDAPGEVVAAGLFRGVEREVVGHERAGADEAEMAPEYREETGEFIEGGTAEPAAERAEALGVGEQRSVGAAGSRHGAEFLEAERFAAKADAFLREENRATQAQPHEERSEQQQRSPERERQQRQGKIHEPLRRRVGTCGRIVASPAGPRGQ